LRGSYNVAFGEPTVLLGAAFLAASLSLAMGWRLTAVAVYGAVAGVMIVLLGTQIIRSMPPTKAPVLAGLGFIFTGLGAILVLPAVLWPQWRWLRAPAVLLLLAGAAIWGVTAFNAYPAHLKGFAEWKG
jgi:putative membrane protein